MPENLIDKLFEVSVEIKPDNPVGNRSRSSRLFFHTSGDWRVVPHKDSWWVVGYHLAYPARDRDDAERLRNELSHQHKPSQREK